MSVIKFKETVKDDALTAIKNAIDAGAGPGTIEIRSGSIPATPETAATGTLLATLVLSDPCGNVATGALTFSAIAQDSSADATGTAGYARIKDSNAVAIFDCDITATGGGGTLQMNTTSIVINGPVLISSFILSIP